MSMKLIIKMMMLINIIFTIKNTKLYAPVVTLSERVTLTAIKIFQNFLQRV